MVIVVVGYNGLSMALIFLIKACQLRGKWRKWKANKKLQREARYKLDRMNRHHNDSEMPSLFYQRKRAFISKEKDETRFYCKATRKSVAPALRNIHQPSIRVQSIE